MIDAREAETMKLPDKASYHSIIPHGCYAACGPNSCCCCIACAKGGGLEAVGPAPEVALVVHWDDGRRRVPFHYFCDDISARCYVFLSQRRAGEETQSRRIREMLRRTADCKTFAVTDSFFLVTILFILCRLIRDTTRTEGRTPSATRNIAALRAHSRKERRVRLPREPRALRRVEDSEKFLALVAENATSLPNHHPL